MLRRRGGGGGSSGPSIVESATAPTGVAGLVWRNAGNHKAFLGGEWRDVNYYDGDKALIAINYLTKYTGVLIGEDYLSFSGSGGAVLLAGLDTSLQRGGYVEMELNTFSYLVPSFGLGPNTSWYTGDADTLSISYVGIAYPGGTNLKFTLAPQKRIGISRSLTDEIKYWLEGVSLAIIPQEFTIGAENWHPTIFGGRAGQHGLSGSFYVDESTILYLPDGYRPINEQS